MNMKPKFKTNWPRIHLESEILRAVSNLPIQDGNCLNLGCGVEGRYAELLANFDVDGVDIADPGTRTMPWRFHRCDARKLPFADAMFDVAIAIESFEHIEDNAAAMREVARTLKPGGGYCCYYSYQVDVAIRVWPSRPSLLQSGIAYKIG